MQIKKLFGKLFNIGVNAYFSVKIYFSDVNLYLSGY